jgi:hypothetical protein
VKKLVVALAGTACTLGLLAGPAFADGANWDGAKRSQIAVNRCGNAGIGNGGETFTDAGCTKRREAGENRGHGEIDPGNSGDHNANNTT